MYKRTKDRYNITEYRTVTIYRHQRLKISVIDVLVFFSPIKLDCMSRSH